MFSGDGYTIPELYSKQICEKENWEPRIVGRVHAGTDSRGIRTLHQRHVKTPNAVFANGSIGAVNRFVQIKPIVLQSLR